MKDSTVKKIDDAKTKFQALAQRVNQTRAITITSLMEASVEELRKQKNGRFVWLKPMIFKGVQYQPGDVIPADVIGLEGKERSIIHQHRTIQPQWHIQMGEAHSRFNARVSAVQPAFDKLLQLEGQYKRDENEIAALKDALKDVQNRLKDCENEIEELIDSVLAMPELEAE